MKTLAFTILFVLVLTPVVLAEPQKTSSGVSGKISNLILKLDQLEKKQEEILKQQNGLIAEIQNLKIQSRK